MNPQNNPQFFSGQPFPGMPFHIGNLHGAAQPNPQFFQHVVMPPVVPQNVKPTLELQIIEESQEEVK